MLLKNFGIEDSKFENNCTPIVETLDSEDSDLENKTVEHFKNYNDGNDTFRSTSKKKKIPASVFHIWLISQLRNAHTKLVGGAFS